MFSRAIGNKYPSEGDNQACSCWQSAAEAGLFSVQLVLVGQASILNVTAACRAGRLTGSVSSPQNSNQT